ncbi:pentapeptide repeat-containing protein [Streptomyces virginiae]|uniref:pentapeptide repeat-containing protein n=1 Tax=Streptomyces virginiae TaxID=1961 RepID=UPI0035DCDFB0
MVSTLPGLAALAAVLFTWLQIGQASKELRISEEGQITNRFNTAITNLGAPSMHVRIGGIYALGRIMQDSPRDDPTVASVLSAYIRDKAPLSTKKPAQSDETTVPPADVCAALTVLANRPIALRSDGTEPVFVVDLQNVNLAGLRLDSVPLFGPNATKKRNFRGVNLNSSNLKRSVFSLSDFHRADLRRTNLVAAEFVKSDLSDAWLAGANLEHALLFDSNLTRVHAAHANLTYANFGKPTGLAIAEAANLSEADLRRATLTDTGLRGVNLTRANLAGANLAGANLAGANLAGANLAGADLRGAILHSPDGPSWSATVGDASFNAADLRGADLRDVDFKEADLRGADLRGAKLVGTTLSGAKMDARTLGVPVSLKPKG